MTGIVFSQSLAHIVAVTDLMPYLMDVLDENLPKAAVTTNVRMGITAITAICGSVLSDACIGRYRMVLYSTIICIAGLSLLTFSASPKVSKNKSESTTTFRFALLLIALGKAGYSPMLKAFGADQLKSNAAEEDSKFTQRVNFWWCTGVNLGALAGIILLAIVESRHKWAIGYGVLAFTMFIAFWVFLCGKPDYTYVEPHGSILTRASHVFTAAFLNRNLDHPPDASLLYHGDNNNQLLPHTDDLRFLDKAAIIDSTYSTPEEQTMKWRLCTVTEVQETKLMIRMFPMWTTFLIYGLVKSLGYTFFLQQGSNMNRKFRHVKVPLPVLLIFTRYVSGQIIWLNKRLSKEYPRLRQVIDPKRQIGIGMLFAVFCCSTASSVEAKRLDVVKQYGLENKPKETLPISIFWLTPQFLLLGAMDGFTYPGIKGFFYDQVPESMKNFGPSFTASVVGVGSLLGVIVIVASDKVSKNGDTRWFADTFNRSHLDYFYQTLAVLSYINLLFYAYVASKYKYLKIEEDETEGDTADGMSF
ncbi:hypothetical protein Syun_024472 [Stephania yunnanensis]|uniref:Uncharacterized protein n=1 Tax=Stephania yunnanensis TaxID=152371 RepID=A0AAP0NKT5_9MAGN